MPRPRKADRLAADAAETEMQVVLERVFRRVDPQLQKSGQVYEAIRHAIVTLALPPGSAVNERLICERLSISRTPLREALLRLSAEHLVTIVPNSGTFVSQIDLQAVFDGHLVRDALEMKVVKLAAGRMTPAFERELQDNMAAQRRLAAQRDFDGFYELDEAFHSMICEFGASARVWRVVNEAKAQLDRVRRLAFPAHNHLDIVLAEHLAIVDGLRSRSPDAAAAGMKIHLDRIVLTIQRLIVEKRDYFASDSGDLLELHAQSTIRERRDEPARVADADPLDKG